MSFYSHNTSPPESPCSITSSSSLSSSTASSPLSSSSRSSTTSRIPHNEEFYDSMIKRALEQGSSFTNTSEFLNFAKDFLISPEEDKKFTLVLDIDETLLHSHPLPPSPSLERLWIPVKKYSTQGHVLEYESQRLHVHILFRPDLAEFLRSISPWFNLAFWSAGDRWYVRTMVDLIYEHVGKGVALPLFVLANEALYKFGNDQFTKPLSNIPHYFFDKYPFLDIKRTILLDDREENSYLNGDQVIVVPNFLEKGKARWLSKESIAHIMSMVVRMEMHR